MQIKPPLSVGSSWLQQTVSVLWSFSEIHINRSWLSEVGSLVVGQVFQSEIEISVAERTVILLPSGWHYITP
jgi:hypothetical protein